MHEMSGRGRLMQDVRSLGKTFGPHFADFSHLLHGEGTNDKKYQRRQFTF